MSDDFLEGERPEILVAESTTQALMEDPNSLFNLTLSKYPTQQTVYLGRLNLQREQ